MSSKFVVGAGAAASIVFSTAALAQGTASEAKVMLEKAVAALKADEASTLDMINKGEGGFLDRDLYVFCFDATTGKAFAAGSENARKMTAVGRDVRTFKDASGDAFGQELYAAAQKVEGQISEVSYRAPKPGPDTTPVPKVSFVTKVDGLGCGVGYYK
jgi:signal transduction histidine kinase